MVIHSFLSHTLYLFPTLVVLVTFIECTYHYSFIRLLTHIFSSANMKQGSENYAISLTFRCDSLYNSVILTSLSNDTSMCNNPLLILNSLLTSTIGWGFASYGAYVNFRIANRTVLLKYVKIDRATQTNFSIFATVFLQLILVIKDYLIIL